MCRYGVIFITPVLAIGVYHYGKDVAEDLGKWLGNKLFNETKSDDKSNEKGSAKKEKKPKNKDIKVIGKKDDCKVAKDWPNHDVLNLPYNEQLH